MSPGPQLEDMTLTTVDEWQFVQLSLAEHAGEVLAFFERNRDFFVTVEGKTPGLELVTETFTWVPDGVQPHQKQIVGVYRDQTRREADSWLAQGALFKELNRLARSTEGPFRAMTEL